MIAFTLTSWILIGSAALALGLPFVVRRRAREHPEERALREMAESVTYAVIVADVGDRIQFVNREAARLFGYSEADMVGREVVTLMPERFRERHRLARARAPETPRSRTMGLDEPIYGLRRDGTEFPVEISLSPLASAHGMRVVASVRDRTERHAARKKLEESQARFRSIIDDVLDNSQVGVCIVDSGGLVVWVNRAYEQYWGETRSHVLQMDARALVQERLAGRVEDPEALKQMLGGPGGRVEHFDCHVLPETGRAESWLECWVQPIETGIYKGGRIEQYTDVTERHSAEKTVRLFAQIARNIQLGLLVWRLDDPEDDRSLRLVTLNPQGERLLGVPCGDLLGLPIDEVFPALRSQGIPALFAAIALRGEPQDVPDFEYGDDRVLRARWSFRAFPLPDRSVGVAFEKKSS